MAPKTADRLVTTCRACRRRKVGCDRQRPSCRQCRASNITCVYEDRGQRSYHFIQETPGGSSSQATSAPDVDEIDAASTVVIPEHRIATLEARVKSLSHLLSTLQQSSSSGTSPLPPAGSDDDRASFADVAGYLSQQGDGKVRYVTASSWNAMCQDASEIDDILYAQSQDLSEFYAESEMMDTDMAYSTLSGAENISAAMSVMPARSDSQGSISIPASFWAEFPPKDFCDAALKWYFRGYHPLVPLVHVPSFRREYENFWNSVQDQSQNRAHRISFATMLLSFLYAGVVGSGEQQNIVLLGLNAAETITRLHRQITRALKLARFPHAPTLDTLRAYLIQQSLRLREEEPLTSLAFVGLSLRAANILGLHKDPNHFPQFGRIESEVRRRIWWHLVHIDVCLAVAAGLPPLVDLQSWDVLPISELKDDLIDTIEGERYDVDIRTGRRPAHIADNPCDISATSMVSVGGILAASKYHFTLVQRRFLLRLETGGSATSAQEVLPRLGELGDQLQHAIDRIPDCDVNEIVEAGLDSAYGSSLILNKWARLLISTYRDQRFCLVSHAITRAAHWPDIGDFHTRTTESSISFLVKCAELSTNPLYQRFQWSWPGNHQPLHALVLLLNDVSSDSESQYAPSIRNVVDMIFALASEDAGLVGNNANGTENKSRVLTKGGSEVWKFLSRLRARAWRKRGWDPTNSLSREQATRLCQRWSTGVGHDTWQHGTAYNATMSAPPTSSIASLGFNAPATGFMGDELLYSEDLNVSDFPSSTGLFGEGDDTWLDQL